MKTIFSFLSLAALVLQASAQLPVGSWYTGACLNFGYQTSNDGDDKSTSFLVNPATYYTLNEHWGVGGGLWYKSEVDKMGDDQKNTTSSWGVSPGVRYYGSISEKVNCYLQGNLNIGGGTTKYDYDGDENKTTNSYFGTGVHPGIMWNVKERTWIDFSYGSLNYLHSTYKNKDADTKTSDSSFNLDLNTWTLGVALYYTFGSKGEY